MDAVIYCMHCGTAGRAEHSYCALCGEPIVLPGPAVDWVGVSRGRRFAALGIDFAIAVLLLYLPAMGVGFYLGATQPNGVDNTPRDDVLLALGALLVFAYPILVEATWGATAGKRVLGLRSEPMSVGRAIIRGCARVVTYATLGLGYLTILGEQRRSLHDMITRTSTTHGRLRGVRLAESPAPGTGPA